MREKDRHGGDVHAAAREIGRPVKAILDFSASINPLGPSPRARRAMRAALAEVVHYPDRTCGELRDALAKRHGVPADRFLVGNGSSELLYLLAQALPIRHALVIGPTFSEYEQAVTAAGGRVTRLNARRTDRYRVPIERATAALRAEGRDAAGRARLDALFLCNPNSPTGRAVDREAVLGLARAAGRRGIWTIVDEAFADYCEARSVLPRLGEAPRLIVLRSLTKFQALTGLRVGYLAAGPSLVARLARRQPPWSVNGPAQAAALAALADREHDARSLAAALRDRERFARALARIPGVTVFPSDANFLLVELPAGATAFRVAASLRREGVLVRDGSSVPGLNGRTVRLAVRSGGQNRRLLSLLRPLLERGAS